MIENDGVVQTRKRGPKYHEEQSIPIAVAVLVTCDPKGKVFQVFWDALQQQFKQQCCHAKVFQ